MGTSSLFSRPLFQQAYLVNDVEQACRHWAELFGAGPFFLARHHQTDQFSYRGTTTEADVSYAFGYLGDTMIQFIEQHDDQPSIYRDMYAAGEEGFHHVATLVPVKEFQAEKQRIIDMGFPLACELHADGVDAAYLDTREAIGCFTEIHGDPPRILHTFHGWSEAHRRWDGKDPIVERPPKPNR